MTHAQCTKFAVAFPGSVVIIVEEGGEHCLSACGIVMTAAVQLTDRTNPA